MQASIRQCYCSSLSELGSALCRLLNELAPVKKWRVADIWSLKMKLQIERKKQSLVNFFFCLYPPHPFPATQLPPIAMSNGSFYLDTERLKPSVRFI